MIPSAPSWPARLAVSFCSVMIPLPFSVPHLRLRIRSVSPNGYQLSVAWPTAPASGCRQLRTGEPAQRGGLFQRDGPVLHADPAAPLEAAQRRVDTLPGAAGLMRQLLLAD